MMSWSSNRSIPFHLGLLLWLALRSLPAAALNLLPFPESSLQPEQIAVVANSADPDSLAIAEYYLTRRGIPAANLIQVPLPVGRGNLTRPEFEKVYRRVQSQTPPQVQAYALAWTTPFQVDCMSITSAFAFGFDPAYCSAERCGLTRPSPYFQSASRQPYRDHGIRPAMLLAGRDLAAAKQLIDRGIAADRTYPAGTGYLVNTPDKSRSVRALLFDYTIRELGQAFRLERVEAVGIRDKRDVLFYFTGIIQVPHLDTLGFRPGALADHLTSAGGQLTGSGQMSSLRWLEAGATASYGTVVEPCNHLSKFPYPAVAMWSYANGDTALEAYWKSVERPGEGVFIGEPLAAPYAPQVLSTEPTIRVALYAPGTRLLWLNRAETAIGPYRRTQAVVPIQPGFNQVELPRPTDEAYYRLELVAAVVTPSAPPLPTPRKPP